MNLLEAWHTIKKICRETNVQHGGLTQDEKTAIALLENHLDPYLKRIATMVGEKK